MFVCIVHTVCSCVVVSFHSLEEAHVYTTLSTPYRSFSYDASRHLTLIHTLTVLLLTLRQNMLKVTILASDHLMIGIGIFSMAYVSFHMTFLAYL